MSDSDSSCSTSSGPVNKRKKGVRNPQNYEYARCHLSAALAAWVPCPPIRAELRTQPVRSGDFQPGYGLEGDLWPDRAPERSGLGSSPTMGRYQCTSRWLAI